MARDRQTAAKTTQLNARRFRIRARRLARNLTNRTQQLQLAAITRRAVPNRAARANLPRYNVDTTRVDRNIHTITIVPITVGPEEFSTASAMRNTAALMRSLTRQNVSLTTGWTPRRANERIRGFVQVTNTMSPTSSQFFPFKSLTELTTKKVEEMFTNMQQSETNTPFEYLEFMIVIDPATYAAGAGTELSLKRGKGLGWDTYYDEQGAINCAAVALILLTKNHRFDRDLPLLKKYFTANQTCSRTPNRTWLG